jgi:hypothetical protein
MQIKVVNRDGAARVQVVNPAGEEPQVLSEIAVGGGDQVTVTLPNVHEVEGQIEVGEVVPVEDAEAPAAEEPAPEEPGAPAEGEGGGETPAPEGGEEPPAAE